MPPDQYDQLEFYQFCLDKDVPDLLVFAPNQQLNGFDQDISIHLDITFFTLIQHVVVAIRGKISKIAWCNLKFLVT